MPPKPILSRVNQPAGRSHPDLSAEPSSSSVAVDLRSLSSRSSATTPSCWPTMHGPALRIPLAPTSWDYLDKIFQITYALRPIGSHAEGYLRAPLPEEAVLHVTGGTAPGRGR